MLNKLLLALFLSNPSLAPDDIKQNSAIYQEYKRFVIEQELAEENAQWLDFKSEAKWFRGMYQNYKDYPKTYELHIPVDRETLIHWLAYGRECRAELEARQGIQSSRYRLYEDVLEKAKEWENFWYAVYEIKYMSTSITMRRERLKMVIECMGDKWNKREFPPLIPEWYFQFCYIPMSK